LIWGVFECYLRCFEDWQWVSSLWLQ
jgi:hypothetical protein